MNDEPGFNPLAEQAGIHNMINQGNAIQNENNRHNFEMEEAEKNIIEAQLDCENTLTKIDHLLRQDVLRVNDREVLEWKELDDPKKKVLTNEGVDKIMQIMQSYINKETLLSNFDEDTIKRRMLDFTLSFSGLMFMKYEIYYRIPSLEECKDILVEKIKQKVERKKIVLGITNKKINDKDIEDEILAEVEPHIDYELNKIKQEQLKLNLREFEMIFTQLKALVEATHNRAWKGEERGSLRRRTQISEVVGGQSQQMPQKKGFWGFGS